MTSFFPGQDPNAASGIQIFDNNASLKIVYVADGIIRHILKQQVAEVSVINNNIIKLDIEMGPLENIFLPFPEITVPIAATPELMVEAINAFLFKQSAEDSGQTSTEPKQDVQIEQLNTVNANLEDLQVKMAQLNRNIEPHLIEDNSQPNTIYKGFALYHDTDPADAAWAIQKITNVKGIVTYKWAGIGYRNYNNIWNDRKTLTYY